MIKSMTGYGRSEVTLNGRTYTVELKSVNNRYLDCSVRLPRTYAFAEEQVKARVKQVTSRGKVDVFLSVDSAQSEASAVTVNRPLAESYLAALQELGRYPGVREDISVSLLAGLPEIFNVVKVPQDQDAVTQDLLEAVDLALVQYDRTRTQEGERLREDMLGKLDHMEEFVSRVEERSPQTVAEYNARLLAKLQEVLENSQIDQARILTEAALYADKVAVDEETVRLRSHIDRFRKTLEEGGIVGRQIDFLIQEMNRETNTIGSKCVDLEISHVVVDMKSEIEKLREQIQNIE